MIDLLSNSNFNKTRRYTSGAVELLPEDFTGSDEHKLFVIPKNSLITAVYVFVEEVTDAGVNLTVSVGDESYTAIDGDAVGVTRVNNTGPKATGDSQQVVTITNSADITQGKIMVVAPYIQLKTGDGFFTSKED